MQVTNNAASPALTALTTSAPAPTTASPSGDSNSFAKMLSARQNAAHHDGPKPARAAEPAHAEHRAEKKNDQHDNSKASADDATETDTAESTTRAAASAGKRGAVKATPRGANRVRDAVRDKDDVKADTETAATDSKDKPEQSAAKTDDGTQADPALADFLAALHRPLPSAPADAGAAVSTDKSAGAIEGPAPAGTGLPTTMTAAARDADAARDTRGPKNTDAAAAIAATADEAERIADPRELRAGSDKERAEPRVDTRFELPAGLHAAASSAAGHAAPTVNAAAPVAIAMATPATAPEFREALGVQVSVLARDGVQKAELHLNPAEMGPISVQIALDGSKAQVDFGADSFQTRQVIESGLPELAAALRDAGFTLSGGGVSQHSRGGQPGDKGGDGDNGDNGRSASGERRIDGAGGTAAARTVNLRLPRGAVDLYA